jgi:O-acetylhomoserine/O-acetylserine sulfhydrylase-like pyridoxal-dependent enzyme
MPTKSTTARRKPEPGTSTIHGNPSEWSILVDRVSANEHHVAEVLDSRNYIIHQTKPYPSHAAARHAADKWVAQKTTVIVTSRLEDLNEAISRATTNRYFASLAQIIGDIVTLANDQGFLVSNLDRPMDKDAGRLSLHLRMGENEKRAITLTYYRMPSGRFEIVAYAN